MSETSLLIQHLETLSYVGIFIVAIIANVIIPVPEEVILLALGYIAGTGTLNGFIIIPVVILGSVLSDVAMYKLSKSGNRFVMYFYKKFFSRKLEEKRAWLEEHVYKVIFFSRFLVQLRFLGPFFAGQVKVPLREFLRYDIFALIIYVPLYVGVGWYFRNRIEFIVSGVNIVRNVILMVAGAVILISLSKFVRRFLFGKPAKKRK